MARSPLLKNLLFSLLMASTVVPWLLFWGPIVGRSTATVAYGGIATVLYLVMLPNNLRQGIQGGGLAVLLVGASSALSLTVGSPWGALLLFSTCLAVVRSGFLFRRSAIRALVLEGGLLLIGWALVAIVATPTLLGSALGFWSFFLTQSLFVLWLEARSGDRSPGSRDPFEVARDSALQAMGERLGEASPSTQT